MLAQVVEQWHGHPGSPHLDDRPVEELLGCNGEGAAAAMEGEVDVAGEAVGHEAQPGLRLHPAVPEAPRLVGRLRVDTLARLRGTVDRRLGQLPPVVERPAA